MSCERCQTLPALTRTRLSGLTVALVLILIIWSPGQAQQRAQEAQQTSRVQAYQFSHPAGGPTVIGPRWRAQLGHFGYPRTARMVFFEDGNYVDLAKRYRRYVMETGLFVSLREKSARTPAVNVTNGFAQKVNKRIGVAVSEPEAGRGPHAGSPRGVVVATGQKFNLRIVA
jgi:hypothetical protein